jgi:hypothetical protein
MQFITYSDVLRLPNNTLLFAFNDSFTSCSILIKKAEVPPFAYIILYPDLLELERFEIDKKKNVFNLEVDGVLQRLEEDDYSFFAIPSKNELQSLIDLLTTNLNLM